MEKELYQKYLAILHSEMIPAMGCTEPIAVALAGAKAAEVLGAVPDHMNVFCSGNIIKNVKSVIVPNSNGQRGIAIAAVLGAFGGDAEANLRVLEQVTECDIQNAQKFIAEKKCECFLQEGEEKLYIRIEAEHGSDTASVIIKTRHDNVFRIEKNGELLYEQEGQFQDGVEIDKSCLNIHDIIRFAKEMDLEDAREALEREINLNSAISEEGITHKWGAQVGRTLMNSSGKLTDILAAKAAAGSDARMGGCSKPVVINSGSGNQGITITVPLCEYARAENVPKEKLLRALALANLVSVHEKKYIGNLSAYCGAVSAATAAAAGVAFMDDADESIIEATIINSVATIGGMVCDGAKSSCASKIASAIQTAMLAYEMAKNGNVFKNEEGLVSDGVEGTIRNIGRVGREGMRSTDEEIMKIMLGR